MVKQLHVISTGKQSIGTLAHIAKDIYPYIDYIHLRERTWSASTFIQAIEAFMSKGIPRCKIIVNDRVDVAHATNVGGVQLAHHSLDVEMVHEVFPHLYIGRSVHNIDEAKCAEKFGANMLLYGHIFETASKPGIPPRGINRLQQVVSHVNIPVIAIGGITPYNISAVLQTGAAGVAVLSGILLADDPIKRAKTYHQALHNV